MEAGARVDRADPSAAGARPTSVATADAGAIAGMALVRGDGGTRSFRSGSDVEAP